MYLLKHKHLVKIISLTYDKKNGRYQPIYCNNNMVIFTGLEHICLDSVFNERLDNKHEYKKDNTLFPVTLAALSRCC